MFVRDVVELFTNQLLMGTPPPLYLDLWESWIYKEVPARSLSLRYLYAKYCGIRTYTSVHGLWLKADGKLGSESAS